MILGSHNSWSFLTPKKWWQKALAFTAKCQRLNIQEQYENGVRCFDLRLKCVDDTWYVVHNSFIYCKLKDVEGDLEWLNEKGDVVVRVLHDVRKKKDYTLYNLNEFGSRCRWLKSYYDRIRFWCGRNLYDWDVDFDFEYKPKCLELYSSVCPPKIIDDWVPYAYAKLNNKKIRGEHTIDDNYDEILLIDYIDIK